jgi:hypothetical protein
VRGNRERHHVKKVGGRAQNTIRLSRRSVETIWEQRT